MTETILTMANGSKWRPSTSKDTVHCATCDNAVDTPEEIASESASLTGIYLSKLLARDNTILKIPVSS